MQPPPQVRSASLPTEGQIIGNVALCEALKENIDSRGRPVWCCLDFLGGFKTFLQSLKL